MAKRTKTLVGLDIDATGIVAASVAVNGRVRIERAAFAPLEPGIIRDGEVADVEGLAEALRDAVPREQGPRQARPRRPRQPEDRRARHRPALPRGRQGARRRGALPGAGPASDAARARGARPPAARRPQRRRRGAAQRVLLVAARREMVERVLAALRSAGLKPEGVDLSAFATVRALHRAGPDDELVLYLAIGGLTNLAVAARHRVHLRPRLGQRRRGPRRRARRARRADARARLRLAGPRRRPGPRRGHHGRSPDRRARAPDPARRRPPDRLRGAQLPGLPPHAGGRRHGVRAR